MSVFEDMLSAGASLMTDFPWWARSLVGAALGATAFGVGPALLSKVKPQLPAAAAAQTSSVNAPQGTVYQTNNYYTNSGPTAAQGTNPKVQSTATRSPTVVGSIQPVVLFWVGTEEGVYQLGAILTLSSRDGKIHTVTGLQSRLSSFSPLEADEKLKRFIKTDPVSGIYLPFEVPAFGPYFAALLTPIKVGLDQTGNLPHDVQLDARFTAIIDGESIPVTPRQYQLSSKRFTMQGWSALGQSSDPSLEDTVSLHDF